MARINPNFLKLKAGYLFPEIASRTSKFKSTHPDADIIRLGIGDVTLPLPPSIVAAFRGAVDEMGDEKTFRGYGPEQGYPFLIEKIIEHDFNARGVSLDADEVFVSDGSKCDTGNIQEIFGLDNVIAVQDPVYPVYVDTNVMAGRTGEIAASGRFAGLEYLPCTAENHFRPSLPARKCDIIYLCSPNNPTGAVLTKSDLISWVAYARKNDAIIFFDAAYEAYIDDGSAGSSGGSAGSSSAEIPHTIYEIEGAKEVAIEFRSFSKNAGFTGTRCAFTVVPKALTGTAALEVGGSSGPRSPRHSINALWNRRHCTKFNGVSYPVQRAAEAVYSKEGRSEVRKLVNYYMNNARVIREGLSSIGLSVHGGVDAPYIWIRVPGGLDSWSFFDKLLTEVNVVGTPGSGFGPAGEGYFRLSAFGNADRVKEAVERIKTRLKF